MKPRSVAKEPSGNVKEVLGLFFFFFFVCWLHCW